MPCHFRKRRPLQTVHGAECQFACPEPDLYRVDDKAYCAFHLPADIKEAWSNEHIAAFETRLQEFIKEERRRSDDLYVDLAGVVFPCRFVLDPALRDLHVILTAAVFMNDAAFMQAEFNRSAFLNQTRFLRAARIDQVSFHRRVSFEDATFHGPALFTATRFAGDVRFDRTTFNQPANFCGAIFCAPATFEEARFGHAADFSAALHAEERPATMRAFATVSFAKAQFDHAASFENRWFAGHTDFTGCRFARAPNFHGCKLHQDTSFEGAAFEDASQVRAFSRERRAIEADRAIRAYGCLKLIAKRAGARLEQDRFYALEQARMRLHPKTPTSVALASWGYKALSDYGRTFMRPLGWNIVFSLIFLAFYAWAARTGGGSNLSALVGFMIEQIVRPFGVWTDQASDVIATRFAGNGGLVRLAATFQSVVNLGLFFLFFLALRRRFHSG